VEWIDVIDVIRFDTACSFSCRNRENLYRVYVGKQVVFCHGIKYLTSLVCHNIRDLLHWLSRRKFRLAELIITSKMFADAPLIDAYLVLCGSTIRSLSFTGYSSKGMSAAMQHCLHIKELSIDFASDIAENTLLYSESIETFYLNSEFGRVRKKVRFQFPNLKDLTVSGFGISNKVFIDILRHTSKIRRLKLDGANCLGKKSYAAVGQYCQSLQYMSTDNMGIPSRYLMHILRGTSQLTALSLCRTQRQLNVRKLFEAVATHVPGLTKLTIRGCESSPPALDAFDLMLTRCEGLRSLSMELCCFVTDDYLVAIATKAKQIANLSVLGCNVRNTGLEQVAIHCAKLDCVRFSMGSGFVTTEACKQLFRKETSVRIINCYDPFGYNSNDDIDLVDDDYTDSVGYSRSSSASDDEESIGDLDFAGDNSD